MHHIQVQATRAVDWPAVAHDCDMHVRTLRTPVNDEDRAGCHFTEEISDTVVGIMLKYVKK